MATTFNIGKANRYLPQILLIGVGIGTANYWMNGNFTWLQWGILSTCTSLFIGYPLMVIATNKPWIKQRAPAAWQHYLLLLLACCCLGILATELESIIRSFVFANSDYQPFSSGKTYVFNIIIASILGISFFQLKDHYFEDVSTSSAEQDVTSHSAVTEEKATEIIQQLPVKQGDVITLLQLDTVVYFEAFDNYAFVYDSQGEKRLCDYSLRFLAERLDKNFLRVHRKYIINTKHIKHIRPYGNARYTISFAAPDISDIISSKGYSTTVRKLVKIT